MLIKFLLITYLTTCCFRPIISADIAVTCIFSGDVKVWDSITDTFVICNSQTDLTTDSVITEAIGDSGSLQASDVQVFVLKTKKIPLLPTGLLTTFTKLVGIQIDDTGFSFLDANVLKDLVPLKYIAITNSGLTAIVSGTFTANTNLELIDLNGNAITFIDSTAFNGPTALNYLNLEGSICIMTEDLQEATTAAEVTTLKASVAAKCADIAYIQTLFSSTAKTAAAAQEKADSCDNNGNNENECPEDCNLELQKLQETHNLTVEDLKICQDDIADLNNDILNLTKIIQDKEDEDVCGVTDGSCRFKVNGDYGYSCIASGITIKTAKDQQVFWNGTHVQGNGNDKVLSLIIKSQITELLPLKISTTFTNLQKLAVKESGLKVIKKGELSTLTKLVQLEITGNNITSIEASAFNLTLLKTLDLSANNIQSLPSQIFITLPALEKLVLSDNKFKTLRYDWISATNTINEFYLNNNPLTKPIDKTFIWRLQKAVIVDLSGTGCAFSRNKVVNPTQKFMDFYISFNSAC